MMSHRLNQYINIFTDTDWDALEEIIERIYVHSPEIIEKPSIGDSRYEPIALDVVRFLKRKIIHLKMLMNPIVPRL